MVGKKKATKTKKTGGKKKVQNSKGISPWAIGSGLGGSIGALGALGLLLGKKKTDETKIGRANAEYGNLAALLDAVDSMTTNGACLIGTEFEKTLAPFNLDVVKLTGELARLRRRVLIAMAKLQPLTFPKELADFKKLEEDVGLSESGVTEILAMPDDPVPPATPSEVPPATPLAAPPTTPPATS